MDELPINQSAFSATPSQARRLDERKQSETKRVTRCGLDLLIEPGVYQTALDSELLAESTLIQASERFLEIGCGSGVVSLALAQRAHSGVGVDINERAVENSKRNAKALGITNVEFLHSDGFANVRGTFEVIVCNPPYTRRDVRDTIDRMFWDPNDELKRAFFRDAHHFLAPNGSICFGWANFADIDVTLPFRLAEAHGYALTQCVSRARAKNDFEYSVLTFKRK